MLDPIGAGAGGFSYALLVIALVATAPLTPRTPVVACGAAFAGGAAIVGLAVAGGAAAMTSLPWAMVSGLLVPIWLLRHFSIAVRLRRHAGRPRVVSSHTNLGHTSATGGSAP